MAAEAGHAPNRSYFDRSGAFHLNGGSFWATETGDIGTSLGSFVAPTPVTTYTQTYSTVDATVANATYSAVTLTVVATTVTKTNSSPYGFSSSDADKIVSLAAAVPTDLAALNTALAALAADVLQIKKVQGRIIDDMQSLGFAG